MKAEQVAKMKDKTPAFIKMFLNKMFERNSMLIVIVASTDAFYPEVIAYEEQKLQNIKSCWFENTVQVWACIAEHGKFLMSEMTQSQRTFIGF